MKKRILNVVALVLATFLFTTGASFATVTDDEGYLEVYSPYQSEIFYTGEKMVFDFDAFDVWADYTTIPLIGFFDSSDELVDLVYSDPVDDKQWSSYTYKKKLEGYSPGFYYIHIASAAGDAKGKPLSDWSSFDGIPSVTIDFEVRKLKAPKGLKVTAGKKKVSLSFYKASGATKYQIYRSSKKNSGYKRIATVSSPKYVDKKVKKGKTYYYKVRSVRTQSGTVYSSYTSPKKSKKVK